MPPPAPWLLVVLTVLALVAGGCSEDRPGEPPEAVHTAANGDVYNDADAAFATALVQHHAMALLLVDMSRDAATSEELDTVAAEILEVQGAEIQTATAWLADWDRPAPETIRDHANAHAAERGEEVEIPGGDLPGMPGHDDLAELEELQGSAFEERWLELMVGHHEGAIELAETQVSDGRFDPAVDLAESVLSSQQDQLARMKAMVGE